MKKKLLFLLFLMPVYFLSFGQKDSQFDDLSLRNGYLSFATIKKDVPVKATEASLNDLLTQIVKSNRDIVFKKEGALPISGLVQEKYQLYKNGIRLRGAEYVFHIKDGLVQFVHGFMSSVNSEAFTPGTSNDMRYKEIAVGVFNNQHEVKDERNKAAGKVLHIEPVYYLDNVLQLYRPAYQVTVTSENEQFSEYIFISAATGEFLGAESLICSTNFPGTAQTLYNGITNIVSDAPGAGGPFRLQETRNSVLIRTLNMNGQLNYSNVTAFSDNDNNWTAVEHGADRAALDAHWGAETVYDYWLNVHNRNSINGNGMAIESYVHFGANDAQWANNSMRFGTTFFGGEPLTALDVCAHEFGHGVDQYTGNLQYEKESGALDEGFADIWGACIEAWATPAKQRWIIGDDFIFPIRNMANPNATGQPDTYLGTNWVNTVGCVPTGGAGGNDLCGVHTNSGVLNYWFFLISDGDAGTNDFSTSYNITGLGILPASRIAYLTKQMLNNAYADYPLTRQVSIQAARTLFGVNSCEEITVTNAWNAVGVGPAYSGSGGMSISGPSTVCSTSSAYSIANLPLGASVTWSVPAAGYLTINSPNAPQTTLTMINSGPIMLTATITGICGQATIVLTKDIYLGLPETPKIFDLASMQEITEISDCIAVRHYMTVEWAPAIEEYEWQQISGTADFYGSGNYATVIGYTPNNGLISLRVRNGCGWSQPAYVGIYINNCEGFRHYSMSPNPASDIVTIKVNKSDAPSERTTGLPAFVRSISLLDNMGQVKRQWKFDSPMQEIKISVAGLQLGVYTVEISDGKSKEQLKLLIGTR